MLLRCVLDEVHFVSSRRCQTVVAVAVVVVVDAEIAAVLAPSSMRLS